MLKNNILLVDCSRGLLENLDPRRRAHVATRGFPKPASASTASVLHTQR
jgi:hypothetical protein